MEILLPLECYTSSLPMISQKKIKIKPFYKKYLFEVFAEQKGKNVVK